MAFAVRMGMGRFGDIRLAPDGDEEPRFALGTWFAMLFAAGMGIGLVFWASAQGMVAIALLLVGGLSAFQVASVLFAPAFSVVMLAMCAATWKAFAREVRHTRRRQHEELTEDISRCLLEESAGPRA